MLWIFNGKWMPSNPQQTLCLCYSFTIFIHTDAQIHRIHSSELLTQLHWKKIYVCKRAFWGRFRWKILAFVVFEKSCAQFKSVLIQLHQINHFFFFPFFFDCHKTVHFVFLFLVVWISSEKRFNAHWALYWLSINTTNLRWKKVFCFKLGVNERFLLRLMMMMVVWKWLKYSWELHIVWVV